MNNANTKLINIRKKIKNGDMSIGSWLQLGSTNITEIMSSYKFDWMVIDNEHTPVSYENITSIIRVLEKNNILPLVRVSSPNLTECKTMLDLGAKGLIIPNVKNAQELKILVQGCLYPPIGSRGVGYSRSNLFGKKFDIKNFNNHPLIIPMVENQESLREIHQIIKIPNIDCLFIGPYDLSASLGITGNFKSKKYLTSINNFKKICKANNVPIGYHLLDESNNDIKKIYKKGFSFIALNTDALFVQFGMNKFKIIN